MSRSRRSDDSCSDPEGNLSRALALTKRAQVADLERSYNHGLLQWERVPPAVRQAMRETTAHFARNIRARYEPAPDTTIDELVARGWCPPGAAAQLREAGVSCLADLAARTWADLYERRWVRHRLDRIAGWVYAAGLTLRDPHADPAAADLLARWSQVTAPRGVGQRQSQARPESAARISALADKLQALDRVRPGQVDVIGRLTDSLLREVGLRIGEPFAPLGGGDDGNAS